MDRKSETNSLRFGGFYGLKGFVLKTHSMGNCTEEYLGNEKSPRLEPGNGTGSGYIYKFLPKPETHAWFQHDDRIPNECIAW